jgi:hypothetical protein
MREISVGPSKTAAGFSRNAKNTQQRHIQFHPKWHKNVQGDQKFSVHLMITVKKHAKILMILRWPSQNTVGMWTVLY